MFHFSFLAPEEGGGIRLKVICVKSNECEAYL